MSRSPAPWKFHRSSEWDSDEGEILDANGKAVCCFGDSTQFYPTAGYAPEGGNLALVLAAPEMLNHLNLIARTVRAGEPVSLVTLAAVIAKAEGK